MNNIADLKDKYRGNRAFIIGNGPSLANAPFDKLMGEYSFAVNRIALLFNKTKWRPTHYVHSTNKFNDPILTLADIKKVLDCATESFFWDKHKNQPLLSGYKNIYLFNASHFILYQPNDGQNDWWSDDISERVSKFGSSLFAAMQIAVYLGFAPLYVIGADGYKAPHGPNQPDPNHFHPQYHKKGSQSLKDNNNAYFKRMQQIALVNCRRLGIGLYDATQSKGHGVLPKVDLMEVLG